MLSESIEKTKQDIKKQIDILRSLNENYKKSVDDCYPAGISSNAFFISKAEEFLYANKAHLTRIQEEEIDDLERQYIKQFQRLNIEKVCECKRKK